MDIKGLSDKEVEASKRKFGDNRITEQETESFWSKLIGNFGDPMIKILCVALIINVVFAFLGKTKWYESVGIAMAVIIATFVSTFSEFRNENAFQKLQEEASRIFCKVYRNGRIAEVSINDIVVNDSILLQSGDKIPADGIIIDGTIKVDQSVLNGENKEATKEVMPESYLDQDTSTDFLNEYKVFRGSVVCSGNAVIKVTTVGDKSVYGEIACELQQEEDRESPLKVKLGNLANGISKFGYFGGLAIAIAFLFQAIFIRNGFDLVRIGAYCSDWMRVVNDLVIAVMLAVIIIVMAVPEGLPLMIALVSALNMGKMLKDNVLVRKIVGIETAGSLNILFSDKTGTITKGKLEVVKFVDGNLREYDDYDSVVGDLGRLLSFSIHHNTDSVISNKDGNINIIGGNATERAILSYAAKVKHSNQLDIAHVSSIPFNSENKYSATSVDGDTNLTLIKGAPEKILAKCDYYYDESGTKQQLRNRKQIENKIDEFARRAMRVLAIATSDEQIDGDKLPDGQWTLIGILGIRDEVRPESITAINAVKGAGVQVIMITGDRKDTAVAIAKDAGIITDSKDIVLTSDELAKMSDEEIKSKIKNIRVVSRALPSDKSRLVRLAQELDLVVGMTGDGVNDSPALKKADVGFAMGGGTEVAKEASDIVILDDNFNSIEKAILYGRTIFNSIRKFIIFQLTINVSAVLISFVSPLLGIASPLSIIQILWVNLVMDTLAALAFGGEPALERFMKEKPKKRDESIISKEMWSSILTGSLWIFVLSMFMLLSHIARVWFRPAEASNYLLTGYFAFFIFSAVFNAFNARTEKLNLFDNINLNRGFLRIIILIAIVQVIITYFGGAVVRCYPLNLREWLVVIGLAISIIPVDLIRKVIVSKIR